MLKTQSVRKKLVLGIIILFMLLIGAVWVIYQFVFSKYVEEEASRNIEFLMQQTEKAVKSSLSMIESSVEYFFMDKTLQEWINMDSPSPNDELLGKLNMDEAIQHSLMANSAWENDLMGVAYFYVDQYAFTFYSNGNFPIHDLTQQIKGISAKMQLDSSSELRLFLPKDDTRTFFIGKSYVDEKQKKKNLNLIIAVDEKKLMEEYGVVNQYKGAHAYLVDRKGNIYSSAGDRKIGDRLQKDEKEFFTDGSVEEMNLNGAMSYVFGKEVSRTGLRLLIQIPKDSYAAAMTQIARQYVLIVCLVLAGVMVAGMLAIYKGTAFLTTIEQKFTAMKNGDYTVKMPDFQTMELHELSRAFNGMTEQIDYLVHEVYEKEIEVKKAELGFLQSQINPHFLFNTFAAIGTRAKIAGQEEIYRMIRAISTLLEAGFRSSEKALVEIRKEMEYVECYLYIQKERFGEKLQYEIKIEDEELLNCQVPRLCLEPIVENAVVHGIEPKMGTGTVIITIVLEQDTVCMIVEDDGVGFPKQKEPLPQTKSSIGVSNTDKRLKLMYGDKYGVFIDKEKEQGARVYVKIPYRRGEGHV